MTRLRRVSFRHSVQHCGFNSILARRIDEDELLSSLDEGIGKMCWQTIRPIQYWRLPYNRFWLCLENKGEALRAEALIDQIRPMIPLVELANSILARFTVVRAEKDPEEGRNWGECLNIRGNCPVYSVFRK